MVTKEKSTTTGPSLALTQWPSGSPPPAAVPQATHTGDEGVERGFGYVIYHHHQNRGVCVSVSASYWGRGYEISFAVTFII